MSWTPWTTSIPTVLVVCAVLAWWFTEPKTAHLNFIVTVGCTLFFWAVAPELAQESPAWLYQAAINTATFLRLDILLAYHANMIFTGAAVLWLAHRAWQTLRKPVPDLINILGVDVPDPPDVSLAGIRADAATLTWTRPRANRPVGKFMIQVNGVNVGDSASQETAITVTGLKPNHFYNIRVIAVGNNNFQAGSRVIRLRTFAKDGRPELGNGRLPSNFAPEEPHVATLGDTHDDEGIPRSPGAGVETVSIPDGSIVTAQNAISSGPGPRRNTLTRKHSPSTTSMDSQAVKEVLSKMPEESMQKLGDRFESIRKETEEIQAQIAKDEREHKELMEEMAEEKKFKKRILKEKDDTTEKLKKELGSTDRKMRSTQQKKTQMEKRLREKQNEHKKLHDDIAKWEKEIANMLKKQGGFEKDKELLEQDAEEQAKELQADINALQASLLAEEIELKEKSKDLKEAEDQRKKLPGGEDQDEWRERDAQMRREWETKLKELRTRLAHANRRARIMDEYEDTMRRQLAAAQQSAGLVFTYNQANSSGVDFDLSTQTQLKRRSRNSNSLSNVAIPSPATSYALTDRTYTSSSGFGLSRPPTIPPGFSSGPFTEFSDVSAQRDEDSIRSLTAGAPLSPTATSLLPTGMLDDYIDDDEPPSPVLRPTRHNTFSSAMSADNDPQSPVSSGRSISIISSPRDSSQHLPFSQYTGENSERRSLRGDRAVPSPSAPAAHASRFNLSWLHRGHHKPTDELPALGSLKSAHSQSFPRQTEDAEVFPNKRRISFSSPWNMFNRNSAGPDFPDAILPGSRGVAPHQLGVSTYVNMGNGMLPPDRDPSSPRPVSIASSDFPRPSTDSRSIWDRDKRALSHIWSPHVGLQASRSVSRRPSIHGSPSPNALKTTLADADDEILDESEIRQPPPSVIGSKPVKSLTQRLNPTAPSFMTYFRPKDKDTKDNEKAKSKSRDKESQKEKNPRESFTSEATDTPSVDNSPSESRKSRDALSAYTASVAESRESLSLDQAMSNTPSEPATKDQEGGLRKLLRKGSSSKFSLSSIRGVSGKKGPSSVANSDKNASIDRTSLDIDEHGEDSAPFGHSHDSLNNSPSLGPSSAGKHAKDKVGWANRLMKKKPAKEKESLELEREETDENKI